MSAFLAFGLQKRPGGWDCPHPDHQGGDSVSIFKGRGGAGAWKCRSGSHKPKGGGMIQLVQLATRNQNGGDFPQVLEIAASLIGLTPTRAGRHLPRARPQIEAADKLHPLRISEADSARRHELADVEYSNSATLSKACCWMAKQRGWSVEALEHLGVHEALRKRRDGQGRYLVVRWPQHDLGGLLAGWRDRTAGTGKSKRLSAPGTAWPLLGIGPAGLNPRGMQVILFEGESDLTAAVTGALEVGLNEQTIPLAIPGTGMMPLAADALASRGASVLVVHDDDAGHNAWAETKGLCERVGHHTVAKWVPGGGGEDHANQVGLAEAWRRVVDEAQARPR